MPSERAMCKRNCVFRQPQCHTRKSSIFFCTCCDGYNWKTTRGNWGWFHLCCLHVCIYESSDMESSTQRAESQALPFQIHYWSRELVLQWWSWRSRVCICAHVVLWGSTISGSSATRPCDPMDGPVEYVWVVGTNKSQSWIFWTMVWWTKLSIWLLRQPSPWPSVGCTHPEFPLRDRCVSYCPDHLWERGTWTERWRVGDWVGGLFSCLTMVTVTTTWILTKQTWEMLRSGWRRFTSSQILRAFVFLAVWKRAMTRRNSSWPSRGWQTRTHWQPLPLTTGENFPRKSGRRGHPGRHWKSLSHGGTTGEDGQR